MGPFVLAMFLLAVANPLGVAWADQVIIINGELAASEQKGLTPQNDRDAAAWLKRASEAAECGDWKLAADTLERVITQHGESTIALENRTYRSAMHLAQEQIAAWPPEGLGAYRVLFDPEANRLLEKARKDHDLSALREIARRYPNTSSGPQALDLLSSWLIDRHQGSEAIDLLNRLKRGTDHQVPRWRILQKLAIAYGLSDQRERGIETLNELRKLSHQRGEQLPEDHEVRIDAVQRFLEELKFKPAFAETGTLADSWPHRLGPPTRSGRFDPIEPILDKEFAASVPLPGSERLDKPAVDDVMDKTGRPPVWQAVADGERIYVTCPSGLIAMDLTTFEFAWQAFPTFKRPPARAVAQQRIIFRLGGGPFEVEGKEDDSVDEPTFRTLYREHRGELSTALGLVFLIEQDGTPGEQLATRDGLLPLNNNVADEDLSAPNTLRAYEAQTGRLLWRRGRSGPVDDPLRNAHFYATPIECGNDLIVPYVQGGDFSLAALRPDGSLVRKVLLGSGQPGLFPMNGTLQPTVFDGAIYVLTGAGSLIALNRYDFSLRWFAGYERASAVQTIVRPHGIRPFHPMLTNAQPDEWLSAPPVVVGGAVVIGPHDADGLLAFEIEDGRMRWSYPREKHQLRYVIGAEGRRVLAAGARIVAIDVETGNEAWLSDPLQLTGRPAICGELIVAPTRKGLLTLDLTTGEERGAPSPTAECLGNIFAFQGSLYSIGIDAIVSFTDPNRARRLALDRLALNPNDIEALVRLAWLSVISENLPDALVQLDQAANRLEVAADAGGATPEDATDESNQELKDRITHLRVEVLLKLAASTNSEHREELLLDALQAAGRPDDRVRAGLAFVEHLADKDQVPKAFEHTVALLLQDAEYVIEVEPELRVRSDVVIKERLHDLWRRMSEPARHDAARLAEKEVAAAEAAGRTQLLGRMADCFRFLEIGPRLDLDLARSAAKSGQHETAVFHLERAVKLGAGSDIEHEALLTLALVLGHPGGELPADPSRCAQVLDRLAAEFHNKPIPVEFARTVGLRSGARISDFVYSARESLPKGLVDSRNPIPAILREAFELTLIDEDSAGDDLVENKNPDPAFGFWDSSQRQDIFTEVLPICLSNKIRGLAATPSAPAPKHWECQLDRDMSAPTITSFNRSLGLQTAAVAGRVAALCTPTHVHGIGLTSGREMWPPLPTDTGPGPLPEPPVLGMGDVMIAAADNQTLVAIEAAGNVKPIWRRRWSESPLGRLWAVGDHLVVTDRNATSAFLIDPANGRLKRKYALLQSETEPDISSLDFSRRDPDAHVAVAGSIICRSGHHEVVGRNIATGRSLWTTSGLGLVKRLFELGDRRIGVAHDTSKFTVLDAQTGARIREIETLGIVMPPIDVVLDSLSRPGHSRVEQLLFFARTDDVPAEYVLQPYLLKENEEPWMGNGRYELGQSATISPQMLRASSDYVAVVRNAVKDQQASDEEYPELDTSQAPDLLIVDKATGLKFNNHLSYEFRQGRLASNHESRRISDVFVLNDRIVAVAPEGYFVLAAKQSIEASDLTERLE